MNIRLRLLSLSLLTAGVIGATATEPTSARQTFIRHLEKIRTQADFDALKRDFKRGRLANVPHLMFVIDRTSGKAYYVNSRAYRFHSEFVRANYLSLDSGETFFQKNYLNANRRFILGTLAYQPTVNRFTFEFWEGDLISAELIAYAHATLQRTFFAPLAFKPNSLRQEQISDSLPSVPRILDSEIAPEVGFEAINSGRAVGTLRLVERLPPDQPFEREDIVIFKEVPISVTPIRGVITTQPGTPLSHLNLLTKGWNVPNAYVKDADARYGSLVGKWVVVSVTPDGVSIEPAEKIEESAAERERSKGLQTPRADLVFRRLADLRNQRAADVVRFGAKSANLGAVRRANIPGVVVPDGFTVPFHYYAHFAEKHGIEDKALELLNDGKFHHDAPTRQKRLAELRAFIENAELDADFQAAILEKIHREYAGKGVFVRSSTNAEDLPNFNGAGLYTTVPNVKGDAAILQAIKIVWASIWNFEAFEAREAARIDHMAVYPAVLIQEGVNADSAGVMITTNPFDRRDRAGVYINAKRGLGIRVVEGKKMPEQIIFRPRTNAVRVLTRSAEDTLLTFDENGGVKAAPTAPNRAILTDETARTLSRAALAVKRLFKGVNQDIEWALVGGKVFIVQSRPYLDGAQQ
jgi:rifampicin phosphotransferase